jgi:hypothetical protein
MPGKRTGQMGGKNKPDPIDGLLSERCLDSYDKLTMGWKATLRALLHKGHGLKDSEVIRKDHKPTREDVRGSRALSIGPCPSRHSKSLKDENRTVTRIEILLQSLRSEEEDALLLPQALSDGRRNGSGHLRSAFLWEVEALRVRYRIREGWTLTRAEALGVRLHDQHVQ